MMLPSFPPTFALPRLWSRRILPRLACICAAIALLPACNKQAAPPPPGPVEVTAVTIAPKDTPVSFEFTAQTQSSREVQIRARVDGFLDKRLYTEGAVVRSGQPMFQMDRKPFEATLLSAQGQLAQQQARLDVAKANLARIRPLAQKNAVSQKDLDDAIGNHKQAEAAVLAAQGEVRTARLNLGYTTISSPFTGLSSAARVQEGSYVSAGESSLLTSVSQIDPIWVNFSISENEMLKYREQRAKGQIKFPPNNDFTVEVILSDGSVLPDRGRINFTEPSFSTETGTFLVRTVLPNPKVALRPGQFVRARLLGAVRPDAILVPQRAVLQGAKSHYVWVIGNDGKAKERVVEVGDWLGDNWFISNGLRAGERVVVDGAIRVAAGMPLKVTELPAVSAEAKESVQPAVQPGQAGKAGQASQSAQPAESSQTPRSPEAPKSPQAPK
ncbi:efflux RND transporter periplasmic adaptor subunit [Noviherbaspirillum cavernae]|uniref:Efflux RND transporter periplasmic adaptor subunit n=1 Tax=Noviherbaspirillum cavernae TaxID=2320862 RepID=A0A418X1U6_9BURK|nr:efflux RND transporter periplasmic adaptor subunit [Noviherbaspirillum cavernae]RJG06427.1 efflux RND transporter periplasmic adaptor subunit [Noviherbaspirillum cavernae]